MTPPIDTQGGPGDAGPREEGPRVSREEVRDLSRLRRTTADRKLAGVAGGVARHLDVDPLLVRIGFVLLTFFGGGGVVLYAAIWLLVPDDDGEEPVVRVEDNIRNVVLLVATVIAVASLIGDSVGGFGFPWQLLVVAAVLLLVFGSKDALRPGSTSQPGSGAGDPPGGPRYAGYEPGAPPPPRPTSRPRPPLLFWWTTALAIVLCGGLATVELAGEQVPASAYPAAVMATCGLMLLVGAFYGRAGGLILLGLLAAVATVGVAVGGSPEDLTVGEVHRTPGTAADVGDESLGIGDMRIDLTDVDDLAGLDDRTLHLRLRVGRLEVVVPEEGLDVSVAADVQGLGHITLFGDRADEPAQSARGTHDGGEGVPSINLDLDSVLGEIVVRTDKEGAS